MTQPEHRAEPRYTLAEAEQMLDVRRCAEWNHPPDANIGEDSTDDAGDRSCECGLVKWIRFTSATPQQLAGEAP